MERAEGTFDHSVVIASGESLSTPLDYRSGKSFALRIPAMTGSFIGLGAQMVGGDSSNTFKVYEVLIYSTALSDSDDTTVRNYLNSKWGVF